MQLISTREALELKISVRETRAKHAKGKRKAEELAALEILRAKLAATT